MTDRIPCPACGSLFEPKTVGNRVKEFCSRACKDRIWKLLRAWAHEQYRDGIISADGLLAWGARRSRCTAQGEAASADDVAGDPDAAPALSDPETETV